MNERDHTYVTSPLMPNKANFNVDLDIIFNTSNLTNKGPFHSKLQKSLQKYLSIESLHLFTNGTMALYYGLKSLANQSKRHGKEIITTPFTFAATTNVIVEAGFKPVFCDINPNSLCLDPREVKKKINENTIGILGVHVYGNACHPIELEQIAQENELFLLFDGAHSFAAEFQSRPLIHFGDATALSFHATKLFNTVEGGGWRTVHKES
ncbi:hypothetical protein BIY24_01750 [Halobacteriovorax marinus]|uniref:aminotransferase class I/II-fold pyridoxal phosphate-dependent enzyme n=1 Tax=Halobacteriovorax marinus TaxID=97084 RepID=UPI000BC3520A|nr:aminotransferase class I/II-fold pyridoxal phosphate-dependent enzyme [Halobacteriovorax marinus]ATH06706.1 hypothetical protein BIY24_01750 [Halobacteriovorax marinus]